MNATARVSTPHPATAPRRRALRALLPRPLRALLRDERGSVMTEAVVMLPFFVLVWGCIIYVSQLYEKGIETQAVARECAWRHAKDSRPRQW